MQPSHQEREALEREVLEAFQEGTISTMTACHQLGLDYLAFQALLAKYGMYLPIDYEAERQQYR